MGLKKVQKQGRDMKESKTTLHLLCIFCKFRVVFLRFSSLPYFSSVPFSGPSLTEMKICRNFFPSLSFNNHHCTNELLAHTKTFKFIIHTVTWHPRLHTVHVSSSVLLPRLDVLTVWAANQVMYWLSVSIGRWGWTRLGSHSRLFPELIFIGTVSANIRCTKRSSPYLYYCLTVASGHRPWLHRCWFVVESPSTQ